MTKQFTEIINEFKNNIEEEKEKRIKFIKDTMEQIGAKGVVLGMSGGIDCSTVGRLFQEAGIDVILVLMPKGGSMSFAGDYKDALDYIEKFNFKYLEVPITKVYNELLDNMTFDKETAYLSQPKITNIDDNKIKILDIAKANISPRLRMTILYTLAQSKGYLVAGTGNLSERTMGYFTKWGDGACDINPIADLTKTQVRILAKALDVPERIINKAPSANLWEGQTDEDEMGLTYAELDEYILTGRATDKVKEKIESTKKKVAHKINPIITYQE